MHAADFFDAVEIGERARDPQHAMIAACREPHGIGGVAQKRKPARVRPRHLFEQRAVRACVGAHLRQADCGVALRLHRAGARDARRHLAASFRRRRQDEIGGGHRAHLDVQVDAIDERARQPALVFGAAARVRAALAGESRLAGAAAAAGVHGGDQHETRGIGHAMVRPGDRDLTDLERLAQRIEHLRLELGQLVEEEHSVRGSRSQSFTLLHHGLKYPQQPRAFPGISCALSLLQGSPWFTIRKAENVEAIGDSGERGETMKRTGRLTDATCRNAKPGKYHDGRGLYLVVSESGASWVLRFTLHGRAREMGLGPYPVFRLAAARAKAIDAKHLLYEGVDPIGARKAARVQARLEGAKAATFKQAAEDYIAAHEVGWRSAAHRQQWRNSLALHAYPVLGDLPVGAIDTSAVLRAIKPLWKSAPETMSRVRGRIEQVLNAAKVQELRTGENPARWKGHLDALLPARAKVRSVKHFPAMDYGKLPDFFVELRKQDGVVARLLELIVLTATRLGEATGAKWDEIDLDRAAWTIPAERMKGGVALRVPLSAPALELLRNLPRAGALVFPRAGDHPDKPVHHNQPTKLLRRLGHGEAVHGFRSAFRDWAAETTGHPNHVVEQALAHAIPNAVEAAYRRGDLFSKRRLLMDDWARHCTTPQSERGEVVPLQRRA
jgi:integrase